MISFSFKFTHKLEQPSIQRVKMKARLFRLIITLITLQCPQTYNHQVASSLPCRLTKKFHNKSRSKERENVQKISDLCSIVAPSL